MSSEGTFVLTRDPDELQNMVGELRTQWSKVADQRDAAIRLLRERAVGERCVRWFVGQDKDGRYCVANPCWFCRYREFMSAPGEGPERSAASGMEPKSESVPAPVAAPVVPRRCVHGTNPPETCTFAGCHPSPTEGAGRCAWFCGREEADHDERGGDGAHFGAGTGFCYCSEACLAVRRPLHPHKETP